MICKLDGAVESYKLPAPLKYLSMTPITIKQLSDVIHFTIIEKRGSNDILSKEIQAIQSTIDSGNVENYPVNDNWKFELITSGLFQEFIQWAKQADLDYHDDILMENFTEWKKTNKN